MIQTTERKVCNIVRGVASPLFANVYLHYTFDLWAERWRRKEAEGNVVIVRYADDIVAGFEHEADARRFWDAMRTRLEKFALTLHPDKTRLLEFGRYAADRRKRRGLGRPETFTFLGFIFICGRSRRGAFQLQRKTRGDRMRAKLRQIKSDLRRRMHEPNRFQSRGNGSSGWFRATLPIMRCPRTSARLAPSATTSRPSGCARCGDAAKRTERRRSGWRTSPIHGSRVLAYFTRGRTRDLPSDTRGRSPVPELGSLGSVRGVSGNGHSYRDSPRAAGRCPASSCLHQQSDSNTKPEYIMGHSMQAVSILV
ncbi:reverse transcriptase domain-containing protein, partial [Caballeronia calidae]|uniref:reverse transcriptase domain-containing protein n=1 Tax=Caballeronia calidae TaxID=1777139 RepID=UPI004041BE67